MGKLIKLLTPSCCNSKEKKRQRELQSIEDLLDTDTARSSQLTTRSSADTFTLTARRENLELAVSLLQDSSKRMVEAVNIQIEKAIEIIMSANEDENNTLPEMKNRSALSNENRKLSQIVHLRTECSKIMRNALAEHGETLAQLLLMNQPSIETSDWSKNESQRDRTGMKYTEIESRPYRLYENITIPETNETDTEIESTQYIHALYENITIPETNETEIDFVTRL